LPIVIASIIRFVVRRFLNLLCVFFQRGRLFLRPHLVALR
jgi:hypothetical protein